MIYLIGCGGVGSYIVPPLLKYMKAYAPTRPLVLVDGDQFEESNLDRQLFAPHYIGMNKAEALAQTYQGYYNNVSAIPRYFVDGMVEAAEPGIILCAVDNHAARKAALETLDRWGAEEVVDPSNVFGIFGANEYTDAEAYVYGSDYKDSPLDPRVYYPEILSDHSDDPTRPTSCVAAASYHPQLVISNFMVAAQMLHLFYFHVKGHHQLGFDESVWPVHHTSNFAKLRTVNVSQKVPSQLTLTHV